MLLLLLLLLLLLDLKLTLAPEHLLLLPSWMYHEEGLPVGRDLEGDILEYMTCSLAVGKKEGYSKQL